MNNFGTSSGTGRYPALGIPVIPGDECFGSDRDPAPDRLGSPVPENQAEYHQKADSQEQCAEKSDYRKEEGEIIIGVGDPRFPKNPGPHVGDKGDHGPGTTGHGEKAEILPQEIQDGKGFAYLFFTGRAFVIPGGELHTAMGAGFHYMLCNTS